MVERQTLLRAYNLQDDRLGPETRRHIEEDEMIFILTKLTRLWAANAEYRLNIRRRGYTLELEPILIDFFKLPSPLVLYNSTLFLF